MRAERQAINAVIQGSCADIINEAIPAIQMALRPLGGYVLLQVHDEIVAEAPEDLAPTAAKIVETYMTGLVNHKLRCPLGADAHIGDTWGSAKG
jgi:DNA polymerase-1